MRDPDRVYFSNFVVDPKFESIHEYDDLYDLDFERHSNHFQIDADLDDLDEFNWDSV